MMRSQFWLSRRFPDDAEAGGGLLVAVIQLAITLGAGIGGLLFDAAGYRVTFLTSATLLAGAAVLAALDASGAVIFDDGASGSFHSGRRHPSPQRTKRQRVQLASGGFVMIDSGVGFQLASWKPPLEAHLVAMSRVSYSPAVRSHGASGWTRNLGIGELPANFCTRVAL